MLYSHIQGEQIMDHSKSQLLMENIISRKRWATASRISFAAVARWLGSARQWTFHWGMSMVSEWSTLKAAKMLALFLACRCRMRVLGEYISLGRSFLLLHIFEGTFSQHSSRPPYDPLHQDTSPQTFVQRFSQNISYPELIFINGCIPPHLREWEHLSG